MEKNNVIGLFSPPSSSDFELKTEISQIAIYPVKKDGIVEKMQLNFTLHLTVRMDGYLFDPIKRIIKQEIELEEMNELINHLKNQVKWKK